jgi:predicted O-methyltransferase YrrM
VFEVGTGSGYSTALLSVLVGAHGQVISVDVDPEMVYRATGLFAPTGEHRIRNGRTEDRPGENRNAADWDLDSTAGMPRAIGSVGQRVIREGARHAKA